MWAVVFSPDLPVLQLPVPWHGPACPAHLGWLIPALVTLQQPGDVRVSPAATPECLAPAAKPGEGREGKPELGRALGSLPGASAKFSELLPRAVLGSRGSRWFQSVPGQGDVPA